MRLVLRLLGTWLIGLSVVLLVMDGTRSLSGNSIVFTSFGQAWSQLSEASLNAVAEFLDSRFFADLLGNMFEALLTYPAFAVLLVPGIFLALAGRRPRRERYMRQEQF